MIKHCGNQARIFKGQIQLLGSQFSHWSSSEPGSNLNLMICDVGGTAFLLLGSASSSVK